MPALLSSGFREGTTVSNTYQVPPEWEGLRATLTVTIPANQNTDDKSFWFYGEIADDEAGPWLPYGGLHWTGGDIGKDGTWDPSRTWTITPEVIGKWVRGRLEVPVRMRFSLDIDLE